MTVFYWFFNRICGIPVDMLKIENIKGLHVEISSKCIASCPFCSRNQKVRPYGGHLITLQDFKKLPISLLKGLSWITFAGNFGDLSTNPEMVDIVSYIRDLNPGVTIEGDTNGSLQDEDWWASLGALFRDGNMVFSVDGLADTNFIHRAGTDFNRIMRNMTAFTGAGGVAHWQYIVFRHNEHQLEEACRMAQKAGCRRFFAIVSRDYNDICQRPETLDIGEKRDIFQSYQKKALQLGEFARCKPWHNGSLYIAADGTVYPCCLAHCMYITQHNAAFDFIVPLTQRYHEEINFKHRPLEDIISGPFFQAVLKHSKKNAYCMMKCNAFKKDIKQELIVKDVFFE